MASFGTLLHMLTSSMTVLLGMQEPGLTDEDLSLPKIRMGICAMDRKARSKPMRAILDRLHAFGEFDIVVFGDKVITEDPITEWPLCDCLLSWHSEGFPLAKVMPVLTCLENGTGTCMHVCVLVHASVSEMQPSCMCM